MKTPSLLSMIAGFVSLAGFLCTAGAARQDGAARTVPAGASGAASASDRGLPPEYPARLLKLGSTLFDEQLGLTTVYANEAAVSASKTEAAHYPDGSVIVMEFAEPRRDGENQLVRDERGQPLKGSILHIDVMRREGPASGADADSRAGAWEFSSYRADGTPLVTAAGGGQCAACHRKAGAEKDFVFRIRSWE